MDEEGGAQGEDGSGQASNSQAATSAHVLASHPLQAPKEKAAAKEPKAAPKEKKGRGALEELRQPSDAEQRLLDEIKRLKQAGVDGAATGARPVGLWCCPALRSCHSPGSDARRPQPRRTWTWTARCGRCTGR